MSVRIRLARGGSKKRPFHKIVVADSRAPRDGRFIEEIGFYNPLVAKDHPEHVRLDVEKAKAWLAKGAEPSERIARLFGVLGVIPMPKAKTNEMQPKQSAPKAKAQERIREAAEKEAARKEAEEAAKREAEEAAKAAEEAAKAEAEAPAEEAPAAEAPVEEAPAAEAPAEEAPQA